MRNKLGKQNNVRQTFTGIFERFGIKTNYRGFPDTTLLFKNIKNLENEIVCNHVWFNYTKGFFSLDNLKQGDTIKFEARVKKYKKGYVNKRQLIDERTIDYKLSYPTKIVIESKSIQNNIKENTGTIPPLPKLSKKEKEELKQQQAEWDKWNNSNSIEIDSIDDMSDMTGGWG